MSVDIHVSMVHNRRMTITKATIHNGARFANGGMLHAPTFNHGELLQVLAITSTRYLVADRYGRRGYAY